MSKRNASRTSDFDRAGTGGDDVIVRESTLEWPGIGGGGRGRACFGIGGATRAGLIDCDVGDDVIFRMLKESSTSQHRASTSGVCLLGRLLDEFF